MSPRKNRSTKSERTSSLLPVQLPVLEALTRKRNIDKSSHTALGNGLLYADGSYLSFTTDGMECGNDKGGKRKKEKKKKKRTSSSSGGGSSSSSTTTTTTNYYYYYYYYHHHHHHYAAL
jgi:hypothetical protein